MDYDKPQLECEMMTELTEVAADIYSALIST
jgi:hypothetical protein